jgi:hypothetical protein
LSEEQRDPPAFRHFRPLTIAADQSKRGIDWNCGHGRELIRQIQATFDAEASQIYARHNTIGASKAWS